MNSLFSWVEIPVADMDRAITFYATVFNFDASKMEKRPLGDSSVTATFPSEAMPGGSLFQGANFEPSEKGVLVYFAPEDPIETVLARVVPAGGKVVINKKPLAEDGDPSSGFYATLIDSEGNTIALFSMQ